MLELLGTRRIVDGVGQSAQALVVRLGDDALAAQAVVQHHRQAAQIMGALPIQRAGSV